VRADRLLAILLLLQRGGRTTAGDLARRLEVSERTIYRDVEALGAAGIPVYCETGRNGGIRLLESYRTDLSGLSLNEAELVPLLGLSDVFAAVGVGSSLRRAEAKLLMALPPDQRERAELARRRIYVDLTRWWETPETVPHLPVVIEAVFAGKRLRVRYRRGEDGSETRRALDPYGLVVQGGTWYLVARASKREVRIYRVSRILAAEALDEHHVVPDDFDLATFWAERKETFHMTRPGYRVVVRARRSALRSLTHGQARESLGDFEQGRDEWTTTELWLETRYHAMQRLLSLGADVEVLEPGDLRDDISSAIGRMNDLYEAR
jgi:predicted DNA-binding transcriptional regulator YafY